MLYVAYHPDTQADLCFPMHVHDPCRGREDGVVVQAGVVVMGEQTQTPPTRSATKPPASTRPDATDRTNTAKSPCSSPICSHYVFSRIRTSVKSDSPRLQLSRLAHPPLPIPALRPTKRTRRSMELSYESYESSPALPHLPPQPSSSSLAPPRAESEHEDEEEEAEPEGEGEEVEEVEDGESAQLGSDVTSASCPLSITLFLFGDLHSALVPLPALSSF
jgi:hypothetical protein